MSNNTVQQAAMQKYPVKMESITLNDKVIEYDYNEELREAFIAGYELALQEGAKSAEQELEQLRQWKREAIEVMPDLQAIGKELHVPLGESIHDKILPAIIHLKAHIENLERLVPYR